MCSVAGIDLWVQSIGAFKIHHFIARVALQRSQGLSVGRQPGFPSFIYVIRLSPPHPFAVHELKIEPPSVGGFRRNKRGEIGKSDKSVWFLKQTSSFVRDMHLSWQHDWPRL